MGLPLVLAIIGGSPQQFKPLVDLYWRAVEHVGHDASKLAVASHSHGFVAETNEIAVDKFYPVKRRYLSNRLVKVIQKGQYFSCMAISIMSAV